MRHLTGIISIIPHVIIVVAVLRLNSKKSTSESKLMLTGSIISTLVSFYYVLVMPVLLELGKSDTLHEYMSLVAFVNIIGLFIFSIGLLMFVGKLSTDKNAQPNNEKHFDSLHLD